MHNKDRGGNLNLGLHNAVNISEMYIVYKKTEFFLLTCVMTVKNNKKAGGTN